MFDQLIGDLEKWLYTLYPSIFYLKPGTLQPVLDPRYTIDFLMGSIVVFITQTLALFFMGVLRMRHPPIAFNPGYIKIWNFLNLTYPFVWGIMAALFTNEWTYR